MTRSSWVLLALVALLAVLPLALVRGEWGGSDGEAESVATANRPGFEPRVSPLYEPPSGEVESGLFALQAAVGGGVLGFAVGAYWMRTRLVRSA